MIIDYNKFPFSPKKLNRLRETSSLAKMFLEKNGNKVNGEYLELLGPGIKLGRELHTTGRAVVNTSGLFGKKVVWVALETIEKVWIPLHTLLGIDSMDGYFKTGEFISESILPRRGKVENIYHPELVKDFNFSKVFNCHKKSFVEFIAEVEIHRIFENKIIRYLGFVIRPYEAPTDSHETSVERFNRGMKRVEIQHLWEVRLTREAQRKKDQAEAAERVRRQREEEQERIRRAEVERREREEAIRSEKAMYNQRNSHFRDSNVLYDGKQHSYYLSNLVLQSMTNFVDNCFPEYNLKEMASKIATQRGKRLATFMSILDRKGNERRDSDTELHSKIESFYQHKFVEEDDTFRLFKIFANQITLNPFRTEWHIYDKDLSLAGTIDLVDYSNDKFTIYVWSTSDKLIENGMAVVKNKYDQKALPPISHLDDCAYNRYALQLSLYKYILEKNYGIEVSELRLGIFHPAYNKPYVLKIPYLKNEVETLMSLRESIIL